MIKADKVKEGEQEQEQEDPGSVKPAPNNTEEDETSLLDQGSGEEEDEDEEDVEEKVEEELLKEEDEVSVREVDKVEMEVERRGGEEVLTFMDVKDRTDPLNVKQNNSFSSLAITSPKDIIMSDDGATEVNDKCKAEAKASLVTKANPGSNISHQAEAINEELASAADVYGGDEEKQGIDTESGEEEDDETVEEEEADEEVKIMKEVKGRSKEGERGEAAKKGCSFGAVRMAATDRRYKEVKAKIKSKTLRNHMIQA